MEQIAFDTLEFADTLRKHGMSQEQAEGLARASQKALAQAIEIKELATKQDLAKLKLEIIQWVVGSNVALAAFLVAIMAYMRL